MSDENVTEYKGYRIIQMASGFYFIMQSDYVRVGMALSKEEAYMIVDVIVAGRKLNDRKEND